eukprot:s2478_g5.t1
MRMRRKKNAAREADAVCPKLNILSPASNGPHAFGGSAATPPCSPWPPAPAAPRTLAQRLFESALQESDGFAPSSQKARPKGEALSKLEESLLSLQGETQSQVALLVASGTRSCAV